MGLDTFPLLQDHTFLLTYNNTVFKVKLEYQGLSQEKTYSFAQFVSLQQAHCQIEDVCRAVLYNIERREKLTPIQSDNFIIFPETSQWPLSKKVQFIIDDKTLNCHPDLILLKITCKDVDNCGSEIVEVGVSPNKRKRLSDSKLQDRSSGHLKNTRDTTSSDRKRLSDRKLQDRGNGHRETCLSDRKVQASNFTHTHNNVKTFDKLINKNDDTEIGERSSIPLLMSSNKQASLSRSEQNVVNERNTGKVINTGPVASCSDLSRSRYMNRIGSESVMESSISAQVMMAKEKARQVPNNEKVDKVKKLSDKSDRQRDEDVKKTMSSVTQLNKDDKISDSNSPEDENDVNRKQMRKMMTRSGSGSVKKQVLQKEKVGNEDKNILAQTKSRKKNNQGHDNMVGNFNCNVVPSGSPKAAFQRCHNEIYKYENSHNVQRNTTPRFSNKKFRKKPGNVYSSLETSDKNVVEISDDGSVVYESEEMDMTLLSQVSVDESPGRLIMNWGSPDRRKQCQREPKSSYARAQVRVKRDHEISTRGASVHGFPAKRGRPRKTHSVYSPSVSQSATCANNTPVMSTFSSIASDEVNVNSQQSSTTDKEDHAGNRRKRVLNDKSFRMEARHTDASGSSFISRFPKRSTRSIKASPSWRTLLSNETDLSQLPDLAKVSITLKAKQQLLEARQHLLESKDGVWLFLRSSHK